MTETAIVEMPKPETSAPITPMQMLEIAVSQGADLDKLTKLMDLQERWEANEARKAFAAALVAFKAEAPVLKKDKKVSFEAKGQTTSYSHTSLGNAAEVLGPILSKHDLAHNYKTEQLEGGRVRVTCVLSHVLGHSESVALESGRDTSGSKNDIQALGSAITYLERYTLLLVTGVATDEDDDGEETSEFITAEQKAELIELMQETETDTGKFLEFLRVDALDNLRAEFFQKAKHALETKKAQQ